MASSSEEGLALAFVPSGFDVDLGPVELAPFSCLLVPLMRCWGQELLGSLSSAGGRPRGPVAGQQLAPCLQRVAWVAPR